MMRTRIKIQTDIESTMNMSLTRSTMKERIIVKVLRQIMMMRRVMKVAKCQVEYRRQLLKIMDMSVPITH